MPFPTFTFAKQFYLVQCKYKDMAKHLDFCWTQSLMHLSWTLLVAVKELPNNYC